MDANLSKYLAFVKTVEYGSFTRAAEMLHYSQSGISRMLCFFCYCALEQTTALWGSSYLALSRGFSAQDAARFASLFFLGITAGRAASGFLTLVLNDIKMMRLGQVLILAGVGALALPAGARFMAEGVAKGGYVLKDCEGTPDAILIASGSEVSLVLEAAAILEAEGHKFRVVSMSSSRAVARFAFPFVPQPAGEGKPPRAARAKVGPVTPPSMETR